MPVYLAHVAYALMLCAFLARDVLVLRGLLVAGQIIVSWYAATIPVPAVSAWNGLFAAINAAWAVRIVHERRKVHIPEGLQAIHREHFAAMAPAEFLRWWRLGRDIVLREQPLTRDGAHPASLYFILDGTARVRRGQAVVAELTSGAFVGEMSLITGRPANADVDAVGDVRVQQWSRTDLADLRARDLSMWTKVQSALGADLVQKIQRGDQRLAER